MRTSTRFSIIKRNYSNNNHNYSYCASRSDLTLPEHAYSPLTKCSLLWPSFRIHIISNHFVCNNKIYPHESRIEAISADPVQTAEVHTLMIHVPHTYILIASIIHLADQMETFLHTVHKRLMILGRKITYQARMPMNTKTTRT